MEAQLAAFRDEHEGLRTTTETAMGRAVDATKKSTAMVARLQTRCGDESRARRGATKRLVQLTCGVNVLARLTGGGGGGGGGDEGGVGAGAADSRVAHKPGTVPVLDLSSCGICDADVKELDLDLALDDEARLKVLDLSNNSIGDAGARALGTLVARCSSTLLWRIDLTGNNITAEGVRALAEGLEQHGKAPPSTGGLGVEHVYVHRDGKIEALGRRRPGLWGGSHVKAQAPSAITAAAGLIQGAERAASGEGVGGEDAGAEAEGEEGRDSKEGEEGGGEDPTKVVTVVCIDVRQQGKSASPRPVSGAGTAGNVRVVQAMREANMQGGGGATLTSVDGKSTRRRGGRKTPKGPGSRDGASRRRGGGAAADRIKDKTALKVSFLACNG